MIPFSSFKGKVDRVGRTSNAYGGCQSNSPYGYCHHYVEGRGGVLFEKEEDIEEE